MSDILMQKITKNVLQLLISLSILLVAGIPLTRAAVTPSPYQPNIEYYLNRIGAPQKQGFIKEEVNKYRSYPHLDRAYRLQRQNRLSEARKEFDAYLVLAPDDLHARVSYLALLNKTARTDEVIVQSELIISRWPSFVPAYFFKGLALQKSGNQDDAFTVFSAAAAVKEITKEDRSFALATAADIAISLKNYINAGRVLQALTAIEKTYPLCMQAGFAFEKSNQLKESLDFYTAAQDAATSPTQKIASSLALAEIAKKADNRERAKRAYEVIIALDSGNQTALRGLAQLAYDGQKFEEAEKWALLLVQKGSLPEDREFLAQLYLMRQNYAAAIPELKAVVDQQGRKASTATLTALAQSYESAGRLQESAAVFNRLLANASTPGEIYLRYGNLLIRMQKSEEAAPLFEKALLLRLSDHQKAVAYNNLALIDEKSGRYEKAAYELEKSVRNQPTAGGETLLRLALLLNRTGKSEEALRYLDLALADVSLAGDLKLMAHKEKSAIYEKSGKTAQAAEELEKALRLLSNKEPETTVRLAILLNKTGKSEEALRYLNLALDDASLGKDSRRVAVREKAHLLEKAGRRHEAALEYEKAFVLGESSPGLFLTVANLYLPAENQEQTQRYSGYLQKVLEHPDASSAEKCSAEDSLGMLSFKQGRWQDATEHFSKAARQCGESWQRCYYRGLAYYRLQQWQPALEQFLLAEKLQRDAATLLGIALCHKELNRSGAAVHYLQQALQDPGSTTQEQVKQINDTLGYLYAEEHAYDKAAEAFKRSLAVIPDLVINVKLAGVYNRAGKTDEAWKVLNDVDAGKLSTADTIDFTDLKADLLQKSERYQEALIVMEGTQKLQATPARSHALGILSQKCGQHAKAIDYFLSAYEKEPHLQEYALSLGYAYLADRRYTDAIHIFEGVAARNPESTKVQEELGYLNVTVGNNEQAVTWFKKSLESFPVMPQGASEEADQWKKDAYRIRNEITKLSKTFSAALYASYRAGDAPNSLLASGEQIGGGLNGQLGLEAAYRPPVIGLRDDRILELFGRVFGNLNPNSLDYNEFSTQAGIGLRYKFLQRENLWISGERLVKVGDYALDDWLVRLLYSRGNGFEPLPVVNSQNYYLIYGEVDGYLSSETVAISAEVRKGRAFTLKTNYLLAPYLVADGRWQSPTSAGGNYFEGGAGVSLKYFFNATRYENYRNVIDFSLNYKHGIFFNRGLTDNGGNYDSSLISLGIFF